MTRGGAGGTGKRRRGPFAELLKAEGRLALRAPYGLGGGIVFPVILLALFGSIGIAVPGNVGDSGFTILDLYIPTIMVIGFLAIALEALPIPVVRDRESGWLRRVSTTPVGPSRVLAAQMVLNLMFALVEIVMILLGSVVVFGATLNVGAYFALSTVLALGEIFALGLVIAAVAPNQTLQNIMSGVLFFAMMFLSGLWVQPVQVGGILQTVMYYSPSGAAVEAMLNSAFGATPPLTAVVMMVVYTAVFAAIAVRYFRWE